VGHVLGLIHQGKAAGMIMISTIALFLGMLTTDVQELPGITV